MKKYLDEVGLQDFATKLTAKYKTIFAARGEAGTPIPVETVADMTDTDQIYVYTGTETGYTTGNWYYYDGSAWTSGGVYGAAAIDDTLSIAGQAADAEATGDAIHATQDMIADRETSSTATKNYAVGDFVILNDVLYRVTTAIASGETIANGENVTAADTVETQIAANASAIDDIYGEMEADEILPSANLHYYPTDQSGKGIEPATGEITNSPGNFASDFIFVKNYDTLYFFNVTFVYQYAEDKSYIGYSAPESFVKDTACVWIRIVATATSVNRNIVAVTTTNANAPYVCPEVKAANGSGVRVKYADVCEGSLSVNTCGKQLLDNNIISENYTINAYGASSAASNYNLSAFIPLDPTQTKITISKGSKVAQYNENKDFVPGTYGELNNNGTNTITISPYAKYIRVVYYYTRSCMVEYGETASTYEDAKYGVINGGQTAIEIATPGQVSAAQTAAISTAETYTDTAKAAAISTAEGYADAQIAEKRRFVNYCTNPGTIIDKLNDTTGFSIAKYPNTATVSLTETERESLIDKGLCINIARDTTDGCAMSATKHIDAVNLGSADHITIWVHIDALTRNDEIDIYFYSGTADSSHRAAKAVYTNDMYYGWQMISMWKADFTVGGSFDWTNVTDFTVRVVAKKKHSDNNNSDSLRLVFNDLRVGMAFEPKIIFRFDDALRGVYDNAYPLLKARGFGAITYSNSLFSKRADDPTAVDPTASALAGETVLYSQVYCTTAELAEMYADRIDIGNHSRSHLVFTDANAHYDYDDTGTSEEKRTSVLYQVEKGQRDLINMGFTRSARHFAVPGGNDTELCQQALVDSGTLTSTNSQHSANTPNVNPHKIHAWGIAKTNSVETVEGYIADAVAKGQTVVLMYHDIVDDYNNYTDQTYQWLTDDLEAVLDYVVAQGWSEYVVNMSEWYDGLNRRESAPEWYYEK